MAKYDGKDMVLIVGAFTFPTGTLVSVDWVDARDELDLTGAGQDDKEFAPSERSGTITVNFWDDVAGTIFAANETTDDPATVQFFPQGNTSTKPKRAASAFITNRQRPQTHNQGVAGTLTFRINGATTESVVA